MKTETVRARIDANLKHEVGLVLDELGLSFSIAIELFLKQVRLNRGIPFKIKIPTKMTLKTFEETDQGKNLIRHKSSEHMFKKLKI